MLVSAPNGQSPIDYREIYVHDLAGNLIEQRRSFGDGSIMTAVEQTIGTLGEVLTKRWEVNPGGEWVTETYGYDKNLNLLTTIGPEGQTTTNTCDEANQLTTVETPLAGGETVEVAYTYLDDGRVESATDPKGQVWTTEYDAFQRPRRQIDPLGNWQRTTYDNLHRPKFVRQRDSRSKMARRTSSAL